MPRQKEHKEPKQWFNHPVAFETEKEREDFKNYIHNRKLKGIPIYQTVREMIELHKEKYSK